MSTTKEQVKDQVSKLQDKVNYDPVKDAATQAQQDVKNSVETTVGTQVNQVVGGIQSTSKKVTDAADQLNSITTEGLVDKATQGIKNSIDDTMTAATNVLGSTFGTKLHIQWSDPDVNAEAGDSGGVYPLAASLVADTNSTLSSIITLISGLGAGKTNLSGFAQEIVTNASPAGLQASLEATVGRVGALGNLDQVNALANQANTLQQTVKAIVDSDANQLATDLANKGYPGLNPPNLVGKGYDFDGGQLGGGNISQAYDSAVSSVAAGVTDATTLIDKEVELDPEGLKDDFNALSDSSVTGEQVFQSVFAASSSVQEIGKKANDYVSDAETQISSSNLGLVQGYVSQLGNEPGALQQSFPQLSTDEANEIIDLSQGDVAEQQEAAERIAQLSGSTVSDAKNRLSQVNTTIAGQVVVDNEKSAFSNPFDLARNDWVNGEGQPTFTYITTVEELEAEINTATREITEVVVHWTETYTNKNIGAEEINSLHRGLGYAGIGYHYIIRRDGSLQRGRPLNRQGEHAEPNHDEYSIGIAFVGGFNCASGTPNPETFLSSQSLTRAQMTTFDQFCLAFYKRFPGGQILGHNDINITEIDPGFDVIDYVLDRFGKKSVFTDPLNEASLSPSQLITYRPAR